MNKSFKNGDLVNLSLVGVEGNAFAIMATFRRAAMRQGFPTGEFEKGITGGWGEVKD